MSHILSTMYNIIYIVEKIPDTISSILGVEENVVSFRERQAWIAVLTTLTIWIYYFGAFWGDVFMRQLDGSQVVVRFVVCMGLSLAIMIGLNVAAGVMAPRNIDRPPDELERQIEARADRIGFRLLEALVPLGADRRSAGHRYDPGGVPGRSGWQPGADLCQWRADGFRHHRNGAGSGAYRLVPNDGLTWPRPPSATP